MSLAVLGQVEMTRERYERMVPAERIAAWQEMAAKLGLKAGDYIPVPYLAARTDMVGMVLIGPTPPTPPVIEG